MATKRKGKTIPCEGCRERKKKCSAGLPCDRCSKLGIECHYLQEVEPPRFSQIESFDSHKVKAHVQIIQACLDDMEQELKKLSMPVSPTYNTSQSQESNVIAKWKMTLREGVMSIDTNITSYAALLDQIKSMNLVLSPTLIKQPTFTLFAKDTGFLKRHLINTVIRRGHFKATLECVKNVGKRKALPSTTINTPHQNHLTIRIINLYFSCRFLAKVTFHQATFYNMFVYPYPDPESSPTVCALSAVTLTKHCRHINMVAPHDQQLILADFYFNKARQAIALQFDEPSLETMITYTQMAQYMANLLRPQEASMYLEMAVRIHRLLADTDYRFSPSVQNDTTDGISYVGQYEMFKRCYTSIVEITKIIQFIRNQRGVPLNRHRPAANTRKYQDVNPDRRMYQPIPLPDEPLATVRAVRKDVYMTQMARIVGPFFHRVRWAEDDMVPTSFLVETEEKLKHLYYTQIPPDYQLASFTFEDGLTDAEFRRRLHQDPHVDLASVSLAIMYYQSIIALYEPFLPVIPKPRVLPDFLLLQDNDVTEAAPQTQPKRKLSFVSNSSLPSPASESSPRLAPLSALSVYSARAQKITHQNAIIVVRLLEYQCTVLEACDMSVASLLCAWDILMRNSCLGMSEEDVQAYGIAEYLTKNEIQLAREYAVRSIEVLRRGCLFNEAERGLWEHYERIEKQLLDALCQTASPTAKYWEPVSCW
ncbi:hypothetical protein EDC96DRAFT_508914 [Choanephora cucurbitarum]|nr:hypothetical protein EDC96DRAFT_508914 [Choanephora cucurbitarum]